MSTLSVKIEGIRKAQDIFRNLGEKTNNEIRNINLKAARRIQNRARKNVPVDLGNLREDIQIREDGLSMDIFNREVYAPAIEFGLPPNAVFPPPDALAGWAARHGMAGAEWAIAIKIFREGTKAQPYLKPAFFNVKDDYQNQIIRMLKSLGGD